MTTPAEPTWRYDSRTSVLHVTGCNFFGDLRALKRLFETNQISCLTLEAIVYRPDQVHVPTIMRGRVLSKWLIDGTWPDWLWHFEIEAMKRPIVSANRASDEP